MTQDALDVWPRSPVHAVVALGANLGDRLGTLRAALQELADVRADHRGARPAVRVAAASHVVETDPVGGPEQPAYLNAVVVLETLLSPLALLEACQEIEHRHGRVRQTRWGARTLDLDIIAYGDLVMDSEALTLPHPRAADRAFVLAPWLDADPAAVLPGPGGGRSVAALLTEAADRDGVRRTGITLDTADRGVVEGTAP